MPMTSPILAELYSDKDMDTADFAQRDAVRGVIMDENEYISLLYRWKFDEYTFPGGGVESEETLEQALRREMREEAGVEIQDIVSLGMTIEYFQCREMKNHSYAFFAKVHGEKKEPQLEDYEREAWARIEWYSVDEAEQKICNYDVAWHSSSAKVIQQRDMILLEEIKRMVYS